MGTIAAIGSFATAYFWTIDWWRPQTITGTRIGIEDFILGISNGGIAAVVYEEVFRKRLYRRDKRHDKGILFLVVLTCLLFLFLFQSLRLNSFEACIGALVVFCVILIVIRKDLFFSSFINGFLMILIALPVYYAMMLLSPGVIEKTYLLDKLSGIRITGIPIEEIIFYYVFGFMVTLLYEYWQGLGIRKEPVKKSIRKTTKR